MRPNAQVFALERATMAQSASVAHCRALLSPRRTGSRFLLLLFVVAGGSFAGASGCNSKPPAHGPRLASWSKCAIDLGSGCLGEVLKGKLQIRNKGDEPLRFAL